ncbi:MAG: hypothetical protein ACKO0Z_03425 [Betaproteobacteria bacterium]
MVEAKFKVYPSGFMGSATAPQTRKLSEHDRLYMSIMTTADVERANLTGNDNVVRAYADYGNNVDTHNPDQFMDIAIVARDAFGTLDLRAWVLAQTHSQYFTRAHAAYIEDTVNFLINGAPRRFPLQVQDRLLRGPSQPTNKLSRETHEILATYDQRSIVTLWLDKEGGYIDLINSIMLMFGIH